MRHAGPEDLKALDAFLAMIRANHAVKEPRPGYFYCRGRALVHFHVDASGLFADARIGGKWSRLPLSATAQRTELLALLEDEIRARGCAGHDAANARR